MKQIHLIVSVTLNDDNLVTDASVEQEMSLSPSHFPYGNTWVEDRERWEYLTGFDASLKAAIAAINSGLRGLWASAHSTERRSPSTPGTGATSPCPGRTWPTDASTTPTPTPCTRPKGKPARSPSPPHAR